MKQQILIQVLCMAVLLLPLFSADAGGEKTSPSTVKTEAVKPEVKKNSELTSEEFLTLVRRAPAGESWAKMEGTATHRRSGAKAINDTIRIGIRFTPKRVIAQLIFAGKETYELGQTFATPPVFTQERSVQDMSKSRLALYGIEPSDLTLGFLYRQFVREEKSDSFKTFPCRVFLLKGDSEKDYVRVWISTDYCFPLKAHWFTKLPEEKDKPIREMELGGVKKEKEFYLISELLLFGPDWRTRVEFETREAGLISEEKKAPSDLFLSEEEISAVQADKKVSESK